MVLNSTEKVIVLAILGAVLLGGSEFIFASQDSHDNKMIQIPLFTVDKGIQSGIQEPRFFLIKTEKEWENFWGLHKAPFVSKKQIPLIDFEQEMIIAVFSGEKKTGGYGIEITKIEENREKGELIVLFLETQPPPKAMLTQALTQPYHIVKTRRIDFPVKFFPGC